MKDCALKQINSSVLSRGMLILLLMPIRKGLFILLWFEVNLNIVQSFGGLVANLFFKKLKVFKKGPLNGFYLNVHKVIATSQPI